MDKRSFKPRRNTLGREPDRKWLVNTTISEFADRAAEATLMKLTERLSRVYDDLSFGDVHWAGDRWRVEITHSSGREAEAMVGWREREFLWVFDSSGGYRDIGQPGGQTAGRKIVIDMFSTVGDWLKQVREVTSTARRVARQAMEQR